VSPTFLYAITAVVIFFGLLGLYLEAPWLLLANGLIAGLTALVAIYHWEFGEYDD